jgi:hypothetical protein
MKKRIWIIIGFLLLSCVIIGSANPSVSDPIPRNTKPYVSITITNISVMIIDSGLFDYTIETNPDVGSISQSGVTSGVKTCTISNLQYDTDYTWYVNVTGSGNINQVYHFSTKGQYDFDFLQFDNNVLEWSMGPYMIYFDDMIWPLIFLGVIGLTWSATKHVSSVLASILLTFGAFGFKKGFIANPDISMLFSLIAVLCVTLLLLGLFLKKKGDW